MRSLIYRCRKYMLLQKSHIFMLVAFVVPLNNSQGWKQLKYSSIQPHKVEFNAEGLVIDVKQSAMPLIYPLKSEMQLKKISLKGTLSKLLALDKTKKQGSKGQDDFSIQVGLVIPGQRTLGFFEKRYVAKWIKTLFELAPEGGGVDHILFLRAVQNDEPEKKIITHKLGKGLIKALDAWKVNELGAFDLTYEFDQPIKVLALWISIDGDDTKSQYRVILNEIKLQSQGKEDLKKEI